MGAKGRIRTGSQVLWPLVSWALQVGPDWPHAPPLILQGNSFQGSLVCMKLLAGSPPALLMGPGSAGTMPHNVFCMTTLEKNCKGVLSNRKVLLWGAKRMKLDGGGNCSHWQKVPCSSRHPPPPAPPKRLPTHSWRAEISGALRRDRPGRISRTLSVQVLTACLVNVRSVVK